MSDPSVNIQENFYLALRHHKEGRLKQAESLYREILAAEPENAETLHLLGMLLMQLGDHTAAVALLTQAVERAPHFAEARNSLGLAYRRLGRREQSAACFREAVAIDPHFDDAYNHLGAALNDLGRFAEAETACRQAASLNPHFVEAHINLGNALARQGKNDEALASYRRAAALNPGGAATHHELGRALASLGKPEEAEAAYRRAIAINPEFAAAHNNLGNVYKDLGRLDEAAGAFQQALNINPNSAEAHNNLGNTFRFLGRTEAAAACLRRAIAIDPDFAEAYNNLGNALKEQDRPDEAVACYRRAIELKPDYANAHANLGGTLADQDRYGEARAAYERALELDPGNFSVRHMLAALMGQTPEAASTEYVKDLFDEFSTKFDHHLIDNLEYQTPALLRRELDRHRGNARFKNAIDLGCGTGLGGTAFRDIADRLCGIDISSKMTERAREKNIYDDLRVGDIIEILNRSGETYDLILATDVFVYMGNLRPIFQAAGKCAAPGAHFVFSVEIPDEENPDKRKRARGWLGKKKLSPESAGYVLRPTGRYAHSQAYVQALAAELGFSVESHRSANIRKDRGQWVVGNLFVLRRR